MFKDSQQTHQISLSTAVWEIWVKTQDRQFCLASVLTFLDITISVQETKLASSPVCEKLRRHEESVPIHRKQLRPRDERDNPQNKRRQKRQTIMLHSTCHWKDDVDDALHRLPSDEELGRRFKVTNSCAIAASSSSDERSSMLSYLLYGEKRQPCATYDASLPHAASTSPRYGGDGFRGRVKYSGWYWTPMKYGWSTQVK